MHTSLLYITTTFKLLLTASEFVEPHYCTANDLDIKPMDNPNYIKAPRETNESHMVHTYESADHACRLRPEVAPTTAAAQQSKSGYREPIDSIAQNLQMHLYEDLLYSTSLCPATTSNHNNDLRFGRRQPIDSFCYETPVDGVATSGEYCTPMEGCESVNIQGRTYAVLMKTPLQSKHFYQPTFNESKVQSVEYDSIG